MHTTKLNVNGRSATQLYSMETCLNVRFQMNGINENRSYYILYFHGKERHDFMNVRYDRYEMMVRRQVRPYCTNSGE